MLLLHTADLHLQADRPETLDAFATVLEVAAEEEADVVTISGDLFDSPADATQLKTDVRELCSDNPFSIIAIPGNHDGTIFDRPYDLGTDLTILRDEPADSVTIGDVTIVGAPFQETFTAELFSTLRNHRPADGSGVLLLHCTLDIGFDTGLMGDEAERRYLPVDPTTLGELGFDFVLAGHFHSHTDRTLPGRGTFIYPGSPISHSRGEQGPRVAVLIDTETGGYESIQLETHYYDTASFTVTPGNQEKIPGQLADWVEARREDNCELTISVSGYVDADEVEYNDRLRELAGPADITSRVESITHVLAHDLYQRFAETLDPSHAEAYDRATTDGAVMHVRSALADLLDRGEVRR